jgi:hypothetical protein
MRIRRLQAASASGSGKTVEVKGNWSTAIGVTTIRRAELADGETSMTAANDLAVRRDRSPVSGQSPNLKFKLGYTPLGAKIGQSTSRCHHIDC